MMSFKIVAFIFITLFCVALAAAPELVMYWVWNLVKPEEGWQRIALVAIFALGGGSVTLVAWMFSFAIWVAGVGSLA